MDPAEIMFMPELFCRVAEHFDDEQWKAIRATCRRAAQLFNTYCRSEAMAFRCGRRLGFSEGTAFCAAHYRHSREFNHEFYFECVRRTLSAFGARDAPRVLSGMHFESLSSRELRGLCAMPWSELPLRLNSVQLYKLLAQLSEDALVEMAAELPSAAIELQLRGLPHWDLYKDAAIICPVKYDGPHREYMSERLARASCLRIRERHRWCVSCLLVAFSQLHDMPMADLVVHRLMTSDYPAGLLDRMIAELVKGSGYSALYLGVPAAYREKAQYVNSRKLGLHLYLT